MTLSASVMTHLVDKAQRQYDATCLVVARAQQAVEAALQTKNTLDQFVLERTNNRRNRTNISVSVRSLKIESDFSGKLKRAVDSQMRTLNELELACKADNAALISAHRHLSVMQNLQEQMQQNQAQNLALAEQREADEFAMRSTYADQDAGYEE